MQLIFLIKDTLTEVEMLTVRREIALRPVLGALVTTPAGVRIAQDLELEFTPMLNKSLDQAEVLATCISKASDMPVAIIGPYPEPLKETSWQSQSERESQTSQPS